MQVYITTLEIFLPMEFDQQDNFHMLNYYYWCYCAKLQECY